MKQNEIVTPDYREYHILEKWTDEFVFVKLNYVHIYSKIINQLQVIAVLNDPFQSDKWAKYVQKEKKSKIFTIFTKWSLDETPHDWRVSVAGNHQDKNYLQWNLINLLQTEISSASRKVYERFYSQNNKNMYTWEKNNFKTKNTLKVFKNSDKLDLLNDCCLSKSKNQFNITSLLS